MEGVSDVRVPVKRCHCCDGTGTLPDRSKLAQLQAAAWQVPAARKVLESGRADLLSPEVVEALRLRVEYPEVSVVALARMASDQPSADTFRKRLVRGARREPGK